MAGAAPSEPIGGKTNISHPPKNGNREKNVELQSGSGNGFGWQFRLAVTGGTP